MNTSTLARLVAGAVRYRLTGHRTPLNVMVAVTNRCNARCAYCAIPERTQAEPSTDELLLRIDQIAQAGAARVGLWGGEPLVRDDIGRVVDRCADLGMWTTLDTNGYLLPRRAAALERLDHLLISFDGRAPGHDRNREPGAHRKALRAIARAADAGMSFWTLTVLTEHNADDVGYILDLAEARGFRAAFQVLHHPDTLALGRGDRLGDDATRVALRALIDARRAGRPVANSVGHLRWLERWQDYGRATSPTPAGGRRCLAGDLYCNVDVDGAVYPCSLLVEQVPASKAGDVGFAAAFDAIGPRPCRACVATAFGEYDRLFGLDVASGVAWMRALAR
jgi:MoaA/NifB/PqqE/SkfB family radical SAM enzyme